MSATDQHDDVEIVDAEIVNDTAVVPYTGEALTLPDLTLEQLAGVLDEAREFERARLALFKRDVQDEILRRMDAQAASGVAGAWTIHAEGGWKLDGDSPDRIDYDLDELRKVLGGLVEAGLIAEDAIDKVIVPKGWQVAKRPLAQLQKLGGVVKDTIDSCQRPVTRPRAVRVTREVR